MSSVGSFAPGNAFRCLLPSLRVFALNARSSMKVQLAISSVVPRHIAHCFHVLWRSVSKYKYSILVTLFIPSISTTTAYTSGEGDTNKERGPTSHFTSHRCVRAVRLPYDF
ncbi:unnamed protein product [Ixodes persulcatus]